MFTCLLPCLFMIKNNILISIFLLLVMLIFMYWSFLFLFFLSSSLDGYHWNLYLVVSVIINFKTNLSIVNAHLH